MVPDWRRVVVYTHRWLGITGCVLFLAWFVSGIVLMYAGMPELSREERLAALPPLDPSTIRVSPADAARAANVVARQVRVSSFDGRPVYRMSGRGGSATVFADSGDALQRLTPQDAVEVVGRQVPASTGTMRYDTSIEDADQWTFSARAQMPLYRVNVGDEGGTVYYVSEETGELAMKTTASGRRWAYAGAVLHWLYFTPFRRQGNLWAQSVIYLSLAGCVLCLSGLVWGLWRYSPNIRYRLRRVPSRSPYANWMRWHHYAGLLFGLTTFTWIFSGMLSMDPWDWHPSNAPTPAQRQALTGEPIRQETLSLEGLRGAVTALTASGGSAPRELDVVQFQGEPYYAAGRQLVSAAAPERGAFTTFDRAVVSSAVERAMPGTPIESAQWLDRYDAYYYDRRGDLPLPVLRVKFADDRRTWLYADPGRGALVLKEERLSRLNRWLYHGLHSLDFPVLYYRRPLWDVVVIVLSLGGIMSSATIVMPALRRLRRLRRNAH